MTKLSEISSTVKIPTSPNTNFFKYWLVFLRPLHHLTDREIDLATAFLKKRYELSKDIMNNDLLDKIVLNEDYKREIREEVNMTLTHFQVIMGKLRSNKFIIDNKINPRFIPRIKEENNQFLLMIYFDFSNPLANEELVADKGVPKTLGIDGPKRGRKRKIKEDIVKEDIDQSVIDESIDIDDSKNENEDVVVN